jgi:hypothetical protein
LERQQRLGVVNLLVADYTELLSVTVGLTALRAAVAL